MSGRDNPHPVQATLEHDSAVIAPGDPGFDSHMQAVQARVATLFAPGGDGHLQAKAEAVNLAISPGQRTQLVKQAFKATGAAKKLFWLHREAEVVARAAMPQSACRSGCSSCCHINVSVSESEARVISKETGIPMASPPDDQVILVGDLTTREGLQRFEDAKEAHMQGRFGQPCTFLKDGRCSIYEHRPMACRQQINLDDDDLLCRLVEGESIPVPYLNQQPSQIAYVMLWGERSRLADIRDWFPPGLRATQESRPFVDSQHWNS